MKKVLHIIKSNKGGLDVDIFNLYNNLDNISSIFLFEKNFIKLRNTKENYDFLVNQKNVYIYDNKYIPLLDVLKFDYIIVYGINDLQIKVGFTFLTDSTKLVWKSLGGDIYNSVFMKPEQLYHKETFKILKSLGKFRPTIKSLAPDFIKAYSPSRKFFKRMNFVSQMLTNEYEIVKNISYIKAKHIFIPLGSNHRLEKNKISPVSSRAEDIYVGSSAAPSANHIDVFKKIASINFEHNVHVTLSYKKIRGYQEEVLKAGEQLLGKLFRPQTEFLLKEDFDKMLNNCHTAIFNNDRQEGLFAIGLCLAKEMKVFLSETSYIYKYLKSMGYNVFSFQSEFNRSILHSNKISYCNNVKYESLYEVDEIKAAYKAFDFMDKN